MNSNNHFPKSGEDVAEKALAINIATMAVLGTPVAAMAKQLKKSQSTIRRLMSSDACISAMQQLSRESLAVAKARIRMGVADLADKVVEVLKTHLDKNNLNAIHPALKVLGFVENETEGPKDASITVILPGGAVQQPINITPTKDARQDEVQD